MVALGKPGTTWRKICCYKITPSLPSHTHLRKTEYHSVIVSWHCHSENSLFWTSLTSYFSLPRVKKFPPSASGSASLYLSYIYAPGKVPPNSRGLQSLGQTPYHGDVVSWTLESLTVQPWEEEVGMVTLAPGTSWWAQLSPERSIPTSKRPGPCPEELDLPQLP